MKLTNSQEEYLKTIYILEKNIGKVRVTDIAEKLKITKPSVNKAIKHLKDIKLIEYEVYGEINLTQNGEELAKEIIKNMEERIGFLPCFFSSETLKKQIIYTILKKQGIKN